MERLQQLKMCTQPFGTPGQTRLISVAEGVGKMRAALAGRQDVELVVAGRTSAVATDGIEAAIERAKAYEAAGVDALFMVGVKQRVELEALSAAVRLPIMLGGAGGELMDLDYLSGQGVRICLQGHQPLMAAIAAVHATLKALRDGTPPAEITTAAPAELIRAVTRQADHQAWMKAFLDTD